MPDATQTPQHYRLDDLLIDITRQQVVRDGVEQRGVSGLSFRLLHYLLQQGTRVIGFDELIEGVWAPAHVGEETVTQRVKLLRQALGDDGRKARYVRSVRGQGYQLCSVPQAIDPPVPPAPGERRRRAMLPAALAVLAVLAALAWWWLSPSSRPTAPAASPLLQRAAYYASIGQRDNNERALALFRQRLQEAPDDTSALLGLSRAYAARSCLYNGGPDETVTAETLARQVLARATTNADAHAALAYAFDCRGDVASALAGYERAVGLDPTADASRASAAYLYERRGQLADALSANLAVREPEKLRFLALQLASNLSLLGYTAEAETRYRHSFQLYPDNVFSNLAWPTFLFGQGRAGEALAALDEAMTRGTEHAGLHLLAAELALAHGDGDEAKRAVRRASALSPQGSWPATMAWATGAEPLPPRLRLLERGQALMAGLPQGSDAFDGIDACLLFELAGDRGSAFAALRAAMVAGYTDANYLRASPLFAGLRDDPAFQDALAGIAARVERERDAARDAGSLSMVTAAP